MKKGRLLSILLVTVLVLLAACAPAAPPAATEAPKAAATEAPKGPIKIGFLSPTSSTAAESAKDMTNGFQMFWDEHGLEISGRPVEIYTEDDAGDPDVALSKARLLVEQRQVHMLVGLLFANTGLSVAEYVKDTGTPTFYPVISADDITQRDKIPNVIRIAGWTSSQVHHPFGEWVYDNTECRNVYTIGSDYAFGHEVVGGFVNTFTDKGGTVVGQIWNPVGEADFSSYLATIQSAEPDCVFSLEVGAAAVRMLQSWYEFGLKDKIPFYAGEVQADQSIIRGVVPREAAVGIISAGHFAEGRDSPATKDFVDKFYDKYGKLPGYYAPATYVAAQSIAKALESIDGNVEDTEAFLQAVRSTELEDSAFGPEKLDQYDNPIMNVYIRETVLRDDGEVWNVVKETIPNVSQFWHYDPADYLKQPVYSRDYQGIDWP
ncbi:MAG: ABC transporter substrate-binding protein [Anaerolineae bacterium]|jgi:branched-chain amino acid transport system substrate-binding protein